MTEKSKKLIICIDGLGYDLISEENTPFLYKFKEQGNLQRLKTLFAFTGIEYSFFTGKNPKENKIWLEFSKSENSIFGNLFLRFLSFNKKIRTYASAILQLLKGRTYICGLHNIPKSKLRYFDSSVKQGLWKLPYFQKRNFAFYKWPFLITQKNKGREKRKIILNYENDEQRLRRLLKEDKNIYYTQLMEIDKAIHKFGKQNKETSLVLRRIDRIIEKHVKKFSKENENNEVIIWSDHGFADVYDYIDINSILPKRKDYLFFIAGTTLSLWFENEKVKKEIEEILNKFKEVKNLKKLTPEIAKKYNIPLENKYGESVYFVEKGKYFFPNFYQKSKSEKFKAMHGYPDDKELDGFILINKAGKISEKLKNDLKIKNIIEFLQ